MWKIRLGLTIVLLLCLCVQVNAQENELNLTQEEIINFLDYYSSNYYQASQRTDYKEI